MSGWCGWPILKILNIVLLLNFIFVSENHITVVAVQLGLLIFTTCTFLIWFLITPLGPDLAPGLPWCNILGISWCPLPWNTFLTDTILRLMLFSIYRVSKKRVFSKNEAFGGPLKLFVPFHTFWYTYTGYSMDTKTSPRHTLLSYISVPDSMVRLTKLSRSKKTAKKTCVNLCCVNTWLLC